MPGAEVGCDEDAVEGAPGERIGLGERERALTNARAAGGELEDDDGVGPAARRRLISSAVAGRQDLAPPQTQLSFSSLPSWSRRGRSPPGLLWQVLVERWCAPQDRGRACRRARSVV